MHTIDLGIVLIACQENLPRQAIVSVTRAVLDHNKWARHANNVVRVNLAPEKLISNAFTAKRVKQQPQTVRPCAAAVIWASMAVH